MTGATSPWAVCLIASSVPTRLLTTCVAALIYRLCAYIWVQCVCACVLKLSRSVYPLKCPRKGRQKANEHVKVNTACQLHLWVEHNIVFCKSLISLWACQLCLTDYFLRASTKYAQKLNMQNNSHCARHVPHICGGENIYSTASR